MMVVDLEYGNLEELYFSLSSFNKTISWEFKILSALNNLLNAHINY